MMRERERVEWNEYLERKQEGLQPKWVGEEEEKQEEAWGEASFSLFAVRKHWYGEHKYLVKLNLHELAV